MGASLEKVVEVALGIDETTRQPNYLDLFFILLTDLLEITMPLMNVNFITFFLDNLAFDPRTYVGRN
jgi:hypothetical protein